MNATINVRRDFRTERHWESLNDDHPCETTTTIYLVEAKLTTTIEWKDLGSRPKARKTHSGKVPAEITYLRVYEQGEDADTAACITGAKLEGRGVKVELVFDQHIVARCDYRGRIENPVKLLAEVPQFLRKKILASVRPQDHF
jgi:hypothetical protein